MSSVVLPFQPRSGRSSGRGRPVRVEPWSRWLNRRLTEAAGLGRVNEPFLAACLEEIDSAEPAPAVRRLLLARLTELALWSAGGYADSGELSAAGDLLVNPRQKLLLVAGRTEPVVLDRHGRLTDQVAALGLVPAGAEQTEIVDWLKRRTRLVITKPPLLPELLRRLRTQPGPAPDDPEYLLAQSAPGAVPPSGGLNQAFLSPAYPPGPAQALQTERPMARTTDPAPSPESLLKEPDYGDWVEERMGRVASTISFLANLRLPAGRSVEEHLRLVPGREREFLESRLCRFDLEVFHLLGSQLRLGPALAGLP